MQGEIGVSSQSAVGEFAPGAGEHERRGIREERKERQDKQTDPSPDLSGHSGDR